MKKFCNLLLIDGVLRGANFPPTGYSLDHVITLTIRWEVIGIEHALAWVLLAACSIEWVIASILLLDVGVGLAASVRLVLNFALLARICHYLLSMIHLISLRNHLVLVLEMSIWGVLWYMELTLWGIVGDLELRIGVLGSLLTSQYLSALSALTTNEGLTRRDQLSQVPLFAIEIVPWWINHRKIVLDE